jgi:hypothetical protein
MKIKKSSWHYRMHRMFNGGFGPGYKSLCTYFWGTVGTTLLVGVALPVSSVIILGLMLAPFVYLFTGNLEIIGAVVAGSFLDIIALFGFWAWYRHTHPSTKLRVEKEPSLVVEYLKAKKRKVCPLIEYTND